MVKKGDSKLFFTKAVTFPEYFRPIHQENGNRMKKWTIQLTLLLSMAAGIFAFSRYVVNCCQGGLAKTEVKKSTLEKFQSAVSLRGIGSHLLDLHK